MLRDVNQKHRTTAHKALGAVALALLAVGVLSVLAVFIWLMLVAFGMPPWTWSPD